MLKKLFSASVLMLGIVLGAAAQQTTHLQGRVMLNDTLPAAWATIYLPDYGIGTTTNEEGNYVMDDVPVSPSVTFEYSHLGYEPKKVKLNMSQPNHRYAHDERLEEQVIKLTEVFITPNGETPEVYIFRKLHEQGVINRKRLTSYKATCESQLRVEDLDLVMSLLPKTVSFVFHGFLRSVGLNAFFNYLSSAPVVDVKYQYTQTWKNDYATNSDIKILSANPEVNDKVRKQMKVTAEDDFFSMYYGTGGKFNAKKITKEGWKLSGVIEENGLTIDVLQKTSGDSAKYTETYYIIEDLWSVLRAERTSKDGDFRRTECRDMGGGIYLPVSHVTKPIPLDLNGVFVDARKEIEEKKAKGKDTKKAEKELAKMEAKLNGRSCNLNFITPYSIKYSGVVVKD